uniref:Uncharacterized protein n=1 Tax=Cucumis melo TaxID=3656 RepID=A0A9I9ECC0_CUCME
MKLRERCEFCTKNKIRMSKNIDCCVMTNHCPKSNYGRLRNKTKKLVTVKRSWTDGRACGDKDKESEVSSTLLMGLGPNLF